MQQPNYGSVLCKLPRLFKAKLTSTHAHARTYTHARISPSHISLSLSIYIYIFSISKFAQGLVGGQGTFSLAPVGPWPTKTVLFTAPEPLGPQNGRSGLPGCRWSARQGRLGLFGRCQGAQNGRSKPPVAATWPSKWPLGPAPVLVEPAVCASASLPLGLSAWTRQPASLKPGPVAWATVPTSWCRGPQGLQVHER